MFAIIKIQFHFFQIEFSYRTGAVTYQQLLRKLSDPGNFEIPSPELRTKRQVGSP